VSEDTRRPPRRLTRRLIAIAVSLVLVLALAFSIAEALMFEDTREFMQYADQVFSGEITYEDLYGKNEDWIVYNSYRPPEYDVEYRLKRVFTWHNFQKGYIRITYKFYYYDKTTGELDFTSGGTRDLYIEKIDGEWKLVGLNPIPP